VKAVDGEISVALKHGGDLSEASEVFGIPKDQWIDLSTGISPWSWPVSEVPESVWKALPDARDGLEEVAANYYGCDPCVLLAVPGSQYALQHIPFHIDRGRVAIPVRGYAEHRAAWLNAGHEVVDYKNAEQLAQLAAGHEVQHAVVINPNNPTGEMVGSQQLMAMQQQLHSVGGWMIVDEAFVDALPGNSLVSECPQSGLVVLRSVGKFFGLAGLRLGFIVAPSILLQALANDLPPWHVSHPARWVGKQALADTVWHQVQQQRLKSEANIWQQILSKHFPELRLSVSPLFVSGVGEAGYCERLYQVLGQCGVLVRLFDDINGQRMLRFGLPAEKDLSKAMVVLKQVATEQRLLGEQALIEEQTLAGERIS
jgi:cobalamin biosynthetic protein CobC